MPKISLVILWMAKSRKAFVSKGFIDAAVNSDALCIFGVGDATQNATI
jgi:hypothetical protein